MLAVDTQVVSGPPTSQHNLVPDESIVLFETGLRVNPPSVPIEIVGLEIHCGESRFSRLTDGLACESRPDSPVLKLRMDVKLVEFRPSLNRRIEPWALERRRPQDHSDDSTIRLRHREPAPMDVDRVVDEEHRVDAADVRGVVDAERPKIRSGSLPMCHVAFGTPPLIADVRVHG